MTRFFLVITLATITLSNNIFAQDTAKTAQLLSHYYALTDALVTGKADQAALHAEALQKVTTTIDLKGAGAGSMSTLGKDAGRISATKDLKKQREYFAGLSTSMTTLAKAVKLTREPVYLAYCPMKKASWLTSDKLIKNPYYGSSMLTCGEITETIK